MNTSTKNKTVSHKPKDPIDQLIFKKGLRISDVYIDKKKDLLLVILSSGAVLKAHLSDFNALKKANEKQLNNWKLIAGGSGVEWLSLNENLSLRGFIKDLVMKRTIYSLEKHPDNFFEAIAV